MSENRAARRERDKIYREKKRREREIMDARNARKRAVYANNPEKFRDRSKSFYENNREKVNGWCIRWQQNNAEYWKEYLREYNQGKRRGRNKY